MKQKITVFLLVFFSLLMNFPVITGFAEPEEYKSEAYVLMEASTGKIILAKNQDVRLRPASITKIMTLLLIFEALDQGSIKLEDSVTVSEHAASLGGSQVYLEPYESQTVNDMIKCISIASANDASVAMAEHLAGSEEAFVQRMNEKAAALGMQNTCFVNCYGLDTEGHYSSAMDVALMSAELINKHPDIFRYSTVWMDSIRHVTKKGTSEFGLTNTNRLIKSYNGITGLKTGSTGLAKYCLSATARRNEMDMIAVIMAAPDTKTRFAEAASLLNYGFANCRLYIHRGSEVELLRIKLNHGITESVIPSVEGSFTYVCVNDIDPAGITFETTLPEELEAPLLKGDVIGQITYFHQSTPLGTRDILASTDYPRAEYGDYLGKVLKRFFCH